jgi:hypothetical protein
MPSGRRAVSLEARRFKPTQGVRLRRALEDENLLGSSLAGPSWAAWRALLIAAMGEPLTPAELELFTRFTGRTTPPDRRVDELWCVIGRRGGKSKAMATLAVYLAGLVDYSDRLVRGEKGLVLMIAPDIRQAKVLLESSPMLKQLIADRKREELLLTTGITNRILDVNSRDLDEAEAQSLAAGIAIKRIYEKHAIKHAISFHRSIPAAWSNRTP